MSKVASLAHSRLAVSAAFLAQGFTFISLTTRLPQIMGKAGVGPIGQSGLLLMMVLLAGAGLVVAERIAAGHPSAQVLRIGLLSITVGVPIIVLSPSMAVLILGMAVYGIGLGMVDATTNMQAVAVEAEYRRPILPSFHGAWTVGGIIASALTLAMAHGPWALTAIVAIVPGMVSLAPFLPRAVAAGGEAGQVQVPWRPIILVGVAMVLFYMVDTAATTWGPTYLDTTLTAPSSLLALATLPYLIASGIQRLAGDALVARFGPAAVVRVGALVASAALAVVVFAPTWPIAVVGFTMLGLGVAVVAPLSFSAAAKIAGGRQTSEGQRLDGQERGGQEWGGQGQESEEWTGDDAATRARIDIVIARFNQFNYVGSLLGAVMTGLVGAGSLRWGFAVPMVLVLGIIPLAKYFGGSRLRRGSSRGGRGL